MIGALDWEPYSLGYRPVSEFLRTGCVYDRRIRSLGVTDWQRIRSRKIRKWVYDFRLLRLLFT